MSPQQWLQICSGVMVEYETFTVPTRAPEASQQLICSQAVPLIAVFC